MIEVDCKFAFHDHVWRVSRWGDHIRPDASWIVPEASAWRQICLHARRLCAARLLAECVQECGVREGTADAARPCD